MERYNFKIDPSEPSQELMSQHKDFDALLGKYQTAEKRKAKRAKRATLILGAAVLFAGSTFFLSQNLVDQNQNLSSQTENFQIHELDVKDVQVPQQSYALNAKDKNQIHTQNGKTFLVPSDAFVNAKGESIEGQVEVKVKEITNPIELFVENLPNSIEVDGKSMFMDASQIFEIKAEHNGQEVYLADGNSISFEIPGTIQSPEYNMYHLQDGEWKNQKLAIKEAEKNSAELQLRIQHLENTLANFSEKDVKLPALPKFRTPPSPWKPTLASSKTDHYDLGSHNFSELKDYANLRWQFANEESGDQLMMSVEWNFLEVMKKDNIYQARFFNKDKKKVLEKEIVPVVEQVHFSAAEQVYQSKLSQQKAILAKQEERMEEAKAERVRLMYEQIQKIESQIADLKKQQALEQEVVRVLELNGFGLWASGELTQLPEGKEIKIHFKDSEGEDIMPSKVFLVERGQNTLFSYSSESFDSFRFNPTKDNLMWTVLAKNKLGIMYPRDFKAIPQTTDEHTFQPDEVENAWEQLEDINNIIRFEKEGAAGSN